MKYSVIFVVLVAVWLPTHALLVCAQSDVSLSQSDYTWEEFVEDYQQYVTEAEDESDNYAERHDWLEELRVIHENPIDINTAEREDLLSLHFLSDEQVDSLLSKRDRYHGFRSLGELTTVWELGYRERAWLSLLVKFGAHERLPELSDSIATGQLGAGRQSRKVRNQYKGDHMWRDGHHEIITTADVPLYKRAGFYNYDESNYKTKMFLGSNFSHLIDYRYQFRNQLKYGVSLQQDYGERFAAYGAHPWDYSSFYFYYRAPASRKAEIKKRRSPYEVALGDYKLQLGQGLVVGHALWNTALSALTGAQSEGAHLQAKTGTDESRFLRGCAGTLRFGKDYQWETTAFLSWRKLDGTVKGANSANDFDSSASDTITAWKTDGLHRTFQEVGKRNVATMILSGGRIGYNRQYFSLGFNAAYSHFSKIYWPASRKYNKYYMRGNEAMAMSMDYTVVLRKISLQGEMAFDPMQNNVQPSLADYHKHFPYATLNTFRWHPNRKLSFVLQERSFAKDFISPFGNAVFSGNAYQNEHSLLVGGIYRGFHNCEISTNVKYSYHSEPTYSADTCSNQIAANLGVLFHTHRSWKHSLNYRFQSRQQNVTDYDGTLLEWRSSQHLRWQSARSLSRWNIVFGSDLALYHTQVVRYDDDGNKSGGLSKGGLFYSRCTYSPIKTLKFSAFVGGFLTDNYYARCYAYLPQLRNTISIPSFYGKGTAGCFLIDWNFWNKLSISARINAVKYFDRDEISSGINLIESDHKIDCSFQFRCRI